METLVRGTKTFSSVKVGCYWYISARRLQFNNVNLFLELCSISELMGRTAQATSCHNDEGKIHCRDKNPIGTKASIECKAGYTLPKNQNVSKELTCLNDGHWDHKLFDCNPICGKSTPKAQTFIISGIDTNVSEVSF